MAPATKKRRRKKVPLKDSYSMGETVAIAIAGGFKPGREAKEAAAVSTAESDRRRCACSYCCCGLMQIHLEAHNVTKKAMCNPIKNMAKAHDIYVASGRSWERDWMVNWDDTARNKYLEAMGVDVKDYTDFLGDTAKDITDKINPIDDVAEAVAAIGKFIARLFEPEFWVRVGKVILGAGAVAFGVVILARAILGVDLTSAAERATGRTRRRRGDDRLEAAAEADAAGYERERKAEIRREGAARRKKESQKQRMDALSEDAPF